MSERHQIAPVLDYASRRLRNPRWWVPQSLPAIAALATCCLAVYMVYQMHVLLLDAVAVAGSDCGTCRRGPYMAMQGLMPWALVSVIGPVLAWRSKIWLPVARVAAIASLYACALATL